jgi:hypothetical protein
MARIADLAGELRNGLRSNFRKIGDRAPDELRN